MKNQLNELKARSIVKGHEITGMPFASGTSDKTANRAVAILEVEELYEIKLHELCLVRERIEKYIDAVEDAELRIILRLRCINNMFWEDIGTEIGMDRRTASRKYYKFIKSEKVAHNAHEK